MQKVSDEQMCATLGLTEDDCIGLGSAGRRKLRYLIHINRGAKAAETVAKWRREGGADASASPPEARPMKSCRVGTK